MARVEKVKKELEGLMWFPSKGGGGEERLNTKIDVRICGRILGSRNICDGGLRIPLNYVF